MSYVIAAPELIAAAAADVGAIGSTLNAATVAAALPTVGLAPAAADEVSASIAQLFSEHAQDYQAAAGQASAFLAQFGDNLTRSADLYALIETVSACLFQEVFADIRQFGFNALSQIAAVADPLEDQW
jgi:PE family